MTRQYATRGEAQGCARKARYALQRARKLQREIAVLPAGLDGLVAAKRGRITWEVRWARTHWHRYLELRRLYLAWERDDIPEVRRLLGLDPAK